MTECLFLVKQGVPFDVAFSVDAELRAAWCIRFGMFEGGEFDWATGTWRSREES